MLGIVPRDSKATTMAEAALNDPDGRVQRAAVQALGEMDARSSIPKLKAMIPKADAKTIVALAAVLKRFNDPEAYSIYYQIFTGLRKSGGSIFDGIRDKRALEKMGIEEAIGLIPYSGIATGAYNYFAQNGSSNLTVEATAAAALANDPDPESEAALVKACFGRKEAIEVAALRALAKRGDPRVLNQILPTMYDSKTLVSYTAAATVAHLTDLRTSRR